MERGTEGRVAGGSVAAALAGPCRGSRVAVTSLSDATPYVCRSLGKVLKCAYEHIVSYEVSVIALRVTVFVFFFFAKFTVFFYFCACPTRMRLVRDI